MMLAVSLSHAFPGLALEVAFQAPAGVTALFGRSGAGKTTVVNAVAGLLRPDRGRIEAGGEVLLDTATGLNLPPHRRRVGYVFQDARLFPHLTVRQNLLYGRWFAPPGPDDLDRITALLGLEALLTRRPGALSGGEKQRVALGRALLSRPRLLLLDEPLAALDAPRKAEILPFLEAIRDEARVPVLYVSHSAAEVARLATHVVLLDAGRVVASGPATQVFADPAMAAALGPREAGAILAARVVAHEADGLTRLETAGGPLWVPRLRAAPGTEIRLRLLAQDVMLSLTRPEGVSALNILPATIESLHQGTGPGMLVRLRAGNGSLLARITRRSSEALDLRPGLAVHAVLKTVSVAPENLG